MEKTRPKTRASRRQNHRYKFKVWLEIEEFDMETEDGRTLHGTPGGPVAELDTYDQAKRFVEAANRFLCGLVEQNNLEPS